MQNKRKKGVLSVFLVGMILVGPISAEIKVKKPVADFGVLPNNSVPSTVLWKKSPNKILKLPQLPVKRLPMIEVKKPASILDHLPKPSPPATPSAKLFDSFLSLPKIRIVQPYVVEAMVDNYSDAQRKKSFTQGLKLVLEEESRDSDITAKASVKKALAKPDRYVKQFNYVNRSVFQDKKTLFLRITIDSNAISKLLKDDSAVIWIDKKPLALLWLAKNGKAGKILTDESVDDGMSDLLAKKSQELGLKVMLPMLDLDDIERIKASDICEFNIDTIKSASSRYGVSVIAIGCVKPSTSGIWSGNWLLLQDGRREYFIFTGGSVENIITQALQTIANNVSSVVKPVAALDTRLVLRIVNVKNLDKYNEVVKYLHAINKGIKQVELVNINDSNIELAVNVMGGKQKLAKILNDQEVQKLVPNMSIITSPPGIDLDYVWVEPSNEKP